MSKQTLLESLRLQCSFAISNQDDRHGCLSSDECSHLSRTGVDSKRPSCTSPPPSSTIVCRNVPPFQRFLLILIISHISTFLCYNYCDLKDQLPNQTFLWYYSFSVKLFLETKTLSVDNIRLGQLFSFASFFGAEVQSIFLEVKSFQLQDFSNYSHVITGLSLDRNLQCDYNFLRPSSHHYLCRLKSLSWTGGNCESGNMLAEMLKLNCKISKIYLPGSSISPAHTIKLTEALQVNSTIPRILSNSNSIGVEGAKALAEALKLNSTLIEVDLSSNSIGVEGAKALAEALKLNSTLIEVGLSSNSIGVEGAKALAEALKLNSTLIEVGLSSNSIGVEGAKALAEALKLNSTLTRINLRDNSIGDVGSISLAGALKVNRTITRINLRGNSIGNEGVIALAEALSINSTVTRISLLDRSFKDSTRILIKKKSKGRINR
ncbi:hypothetical protein GEMRC1_001948 [Eukaryota sp. GEM-RC1]